jgi:chemotaxis signal transduction protein
MNPFRVISLRGLEIRLVSLVSWFGLKPMRYDVIIIQRYDNSIFEDMGDLVTVFSS